MIEAQPDRIIDWLLEGDPAIRWQVAQDLTNEPPEVVASERDTVAMRGWGRRLLDQQDSNGRWAGGLYSPKWTSTTYTLLLLRRLGLSQQNAAAQRGARILIDEGTWVDDAIIFWKSSNTIDLCVVGLVLSIVAYFGIRDDRIDGMVQLLERRQLPDGSWEDINDVADKQFHTAIAVLEGLHEYALQVPDALNVKQMAEAGHEFLLSHHLFRSLSSGEAIAGSWKRFSFPPRWHYDILRALDHLRAANVPYTPRLDDALDLVEKKRRPNGTWLLENSHPGRTWFKLEAAKEPSRCNTLRALRVLRTYRTDDS